MEGTFFELFFQNLFDGLILTMYVQTQSMSNSPNRTSNMGNFLTEVKPFEDEGNMVIPGQ